MRGCMYTYLEHIFVQITAKIKKNMASSSTVLLLFIYCSAVNAIKHQPSSVDEKVMSLPRFAAHAVDEGHGHRHGTLRHGQRHRD